VELEEQGHFKEATQRLRSLIDAGATTAAAYAKLGGLLWDLDQLDAAEGAFRNPKRTIAMQMPAGGRDCGRR
jgi:hypothetical protein